MQQLELLQQQFARSSEMPSFPNVFACLQQLQQLQRLLEGGPASSEFLSWMCRINRYMCRFCDV
jgi:hypothetical protein